MQVKEFVKRIAAKIADVINGCPNCEKEREEFWETFESGKPYQDFPRGKNSIRRVFMPETPSHLLKWHADETDRTVHVLGAGNWKFQFDNELPIQLETGSVIKIPKGKIHRLIKEDNSPLMLDIKFT